MPQLCPNSERVSAMAAIRLAGRLGRAYFGASVCGAAESLNDQANRHRPRQPQGRRPGGLETVLPRCARVPDRRGRPGSRRYFHDVGREFHTLDIGQHPSPDDAPRPQRGQIGLAHIAFQVGSYAALREAYAHLVQNGVEIMRAANHVNQRSFYFADPDGNVLEIYYEMPYALDLFANGRSDEDEALSVSGPGEPLPQWLLEDWPSAEMKARIERLRHQKERMPA
jgi:catechol 2,3-dioxygenase-like lactoylglutathione lyase family enzyme